MLASEQALNRVAALEASAVRLDQVRTSFGAEPGASSGAVLARSGEMAMRLDLARADLKLSLAGARYHATQSGAARIEARRKQESMKKLSDKAAAQAQAREASRQQSTPGPRRRRPSAEEPR
jgi:hypothetical protein